MKNVLYVLMALLVTCHVEADPNRYPTRSIGVVNADLEPLFAWWTLAAQTTNQPVDTTAMDTNKLAAVSNLWWRLPARPLLDWFNLRASEDNILVVGSLWKVDATIAPAPMTFRRQTIYLRNPPVKEIQNFKLARAAVVALQNAQGPDVQAEQLWESNIQAEAEAALPTNSVPATVVNASTVAQAREVQQDMIATASNLNLAHDRTEARNRQLATPTSYLATFPDPQVYWLDHFALRTGETKDGLEIYDLGKAPGLTY